MGFTSDVKSMYFTDSLAHEIYIFDYHIESGEIGNQRTFVQTPDDDGTVPDGMTVDAEDHVWSARWDGSALYRFAPDGTEVARIDFPAKKVSSVIFGGTRPDRHVRDDCRGQRQAQREPRRGRAVPAEPGDKGEAGVPLPYLPLADTMI